ncbi:hypothetical protein B0A55_08869 [Friedmanniomyces simplex]|uniref:ceramidase n=1 Tax=Friedmanniomyces simplex TaxID=329884 RepID=A0A4U0X1P6_9PEZI|nr:hypothetical protein B0A55_08869 [Friedmanniomyces simplex]
MWWRRWQQTLEVLPQFVEIVTWNDFGESHYVGPIYQAGIPDSPTANATAYVDGYPHQAWLGTLPYQIAAYKHTYNPAANPAPKVAEYKVIFGYRNAPAEAGRTEATGNDCNSDVNIYGYQTCCEVSKVLEDGIFAIVLATKSVTAEIEVGSGQPTVFFGLTEGMNFISRPFAGETGLGKGQRSVNPGEPPRFTIDLSLPPEQRYLEVCAALESEITGLTSLFDEVVGGMLPWVPLRWLHFACWLLLGRIHNREEHAELRGISRATGVSMYLLVCFNVLLDLFMGCSSGGAAVGDGEGGVKMLHFRTLDWGMPALRQIVVILDFVMEPGGPLVASSVTYAGFVGVLTGVRKDFSVSLNFRPNRNDSGRSCILAEKALTGHSQKDPITAKVRSSSDFIVVTNSDEEDTGGVGTAKENSTFGMILAEIVEEAKERQRCAVENWRSLRLSTANKCRLLDANGDDVKGLLEVDDVVALVQRYPTTNEMTHFACVMDPRKGTVEWCRRWVKPVGALWIREHMLS